MSIEQFKGLKKKKGNKYGAKGEYCDGEYFDSQAELEYYHQLVLRKKAGDIKELTLHPVYPIVINGIDIGHVKFDFVVDGEIIDVKSPFTAKSEISRWRRAVFEALYGEKVTLVIKK